MGSVLTFGEVEVLARRFDLSLEQARQIIGRFAAIGIPAGRLLGLLHSRQDPKTLGDRLVQLADYLGFVIRLPGATPDRIREGFEHLMGHPAADLARLGYLMLYFGVLVQRPWADPDSVLAEFVAPPQERSVSCRQTTAGKPAASRRPAFPQTLTGPAERGCFSPAR